MQRFDTRTPISAVLEIPAGRVRFIVADLNIHATTAYGDIVARSF
jgi:hypothetical protein